MPYTVSYNSNFRIIESIVSGDVTLEVLKELFKEQAQMSKSMSCDLMLNDYRAAKLRLSTLDIYELPKLIAKTAASFGANANKTRRALVVTKDVDDYHFYETVTANNSQVERVFFDVDEARQWLCGA